MHPRQLATKGVGHGIECLVHLAAPFGCADLPKLAS
jgi:hypothetical protein